jgi:large subunit ribosomal protein L33
MGDRIQVSLVCESCSARNYKTTRKPEVLGQLQFKKYCKTCDKHTLHLEAK